MSNGSGGVGGTWWYPILVTAVGLVIAFFLFCKLCGGGGNEGKEALALATKIHNYLGTNVGSTRTGLIGNLQENNEFHRQQYDKIACELYMVTQPAGTPKPTPCPPGGGGPSSRPTGPPAYP